MEGNTVLRLIKVVLWMFNSKLILNLACGLVACYSTLCFSFVYLKKKKTPNVRTKIFLSSLLNTSLLFQNDSPALLLVRGLPLSHEVF